MFFLKVHGIHRDQAPLEAQVIDQFSGRRNFVALVRNREMTQDQEAIAGKGTDDMSGTLVVEMVETMAQSLAVDGKQRRTIGSQDK